MVEIIKKILRPFYVPVMNWHHRVFKAPKRYHHLFDEIARSKAQTILEIGTWNGNRALEMIKTAKENSPGSIKYIGFDLFEDLTEELYVQELSKKPPTKNEVQEKLLKSGAEILLIKGDTNKTLTEFADGTEKVDFVFIDGGHHVATISNDWAAVEKLMHDKTVVIFDDYWRNRPAESAKPVVDAIDQTKCIVEVLPEIDSFNNPDFGRLEISFAKVTKRNP